MKVFNDKAVLYEDSLYNDSIRDMILNIHSWKFVAESRHVKIKVGRSPLEADVVIVARTPSRGNLRFIGIELKELDFRGVLTQAIEKLPYFHAVYVVTSSLYVGVRGTIEVLKQALSKGIGIIYNNTWKCSKPILITEAKVNLNPPMCRFTIQQQLDGGLTIIYGR